MAQAYPAQYRDRTICIEVIRFFQYITWWAIPNFARKPDIRGGALNVYTWLLHYLRGRPQSSLSSTSSLSPTPLSFPTTTPSLSPASPLCILHPIATENYIHCRIILVNTCVQFQPSYLLSRIMLCFIQYNQKNLEKLIAIRPWQTLKILTLWSCFQIHSTLYTHWSCKIYFNNIGNNNLHHHHWNTCRPPAISVLLWKPDTFSFASSLHALENNGMTPNTQKNLRSTRTLRDHNAQNTDDIMDC
jgi:hypothetical protein